MLFGRQDARALAGRLAQSRSRRSYRGRQANAYSLANRFIILIAIYPLASAFRLDGWRQTMAMDSLV